jgi:uncharacterized membrane protein YczE
VDIPRNTSEVFERLPILFLGYFICSLGIVTNLYANLGTGPWSLFHVGLANITGLTLGQITQIVGLVIIIISWKLGNAPGLGTIANMIFIGFFIDIIIFVGIIPFQTQLIWQIFQLILSIIITAVGALFYLRTQLGAGPRDGLMVVLTRILDKPVSYVRIPMDVLVSIMGYFLGGPLGLGTFITAIGLGYFMQLFFKIGKFNSKSKQLSLLELIHVHMKK